MSGYAETKSPDRRRHNLPAYGPIDGLLGYVMFYVFVDRATPAIVDVVSGRVAELGPSGVRFGLAAALWAILALTAFDQVRRQLAAMGIGSDRDVERAGRARRGLSETRSLAYAVVVILGGLVAVWAFETAVATGITLISIVVTQDVTPFKVGGFVVMIIFFIAYAGATWSLDRLVIGWLQSVLSE